MTAQIPSVGRIVHYLSYGTPGGEYASQCRAAVVTEVSEFPLTADEVARMRPEDREGLPSWPLVSVAVLNPSGLFFDQDLEYDPDASRGGTWHWPERVEA